MSGLPQPIPVEVRRITGNGPAPRGTGLEIRWSDGTASKLDSVLLRRSCPCATCLEARGDTTHRSPLTPAPKRSPLAVIQSGIEEQTDLKEVWPVGNYALGVLWADNHSSGIYSYAVLRQLAAEAARGTVEEGR